MPFFLKNISLQCVIKTLPCIENEHIFQLLLQYAVSVTHYSLLKLFYTCARQRGKEFLHFCSMYALHNALSLAMGHLTMTQHCRTYLKNATAGYFIAILWRWLCTGVTLAEIHITIVVGNRLLHAFCFNLLLMSAIFLRY